MLLFEGMNGGPQRLADFGEDFFKRETSLPKYSPVPFLWTGKLHYRVYFMAQITLNRRLGFALGWPSSASIAEGVFLEAIWSPCS